MNLRMWLTALLVFASLVAVTGCISTNVKGFSDREFVGRQLNKTVVRAANASFAFGESLEMSLAKELQGSGVHAEIFLSTFPPTRQWRNDEVVSYLTSHGFDSIMFVTLTGSDTSAQTIGYTTHGTGYVYGSNFNAHMTTSPVVGLSRFTSARVTVYDVASGQVIWVGDTVTKAGGALFVGDKVTTDGIATEVVTALREAGHIGGSPPSPSFAVAE